jgi:hypothetical protein
VMQPWSVRQLGALVAAWIGRAGHVSVEHGFVVEGVVSLLVTLGVVYWLMLQTNAPRWMLAGVAVLPSWVPLVQYLALPDLWYAALMAVVFWLLWRRQWMAASLMMFPLMLSRESTSLTLLCFLVAGWGWLRWRHRLVAVLSMIAGSVVAGRLAAHSQANVENLPPAVYLLAKIPWNFMRNVLGIVPWSNVNMDLCATPAWSRAFHFGPVQRIGVCGISFAPQMTMLTQGLACFGLLPLVVGFLWWRHRRVDGRGFLLRFSLLYGTCCLVLSPVLGAGFLHLVGYAWPLVAVALPMLIDEFPVPRGRRAVLASAAFFTLHMVLCALWYWVHEWTALCLWVVLWGAGLWMLRLWWSPAKMTKQVPATA